MKYSIKLQNKLGYQGGRNMCDGNNAGDYSPASFKLGISMSASWAWGVSLGVSFSILQTKGLIPFIFWGIFNVLALTVYGLYILKYPNYLKFKDNKVIKLAMVIIQIFAIWINIKIMYDFIENYYIATIIAFIVIALTLKYKFKFSLESDQWQYLIMIIGLILVILTGNKTIKAINMGSSINWALWGGICLLAGPFLDGQQFQRANKARNLKPFLVASLSFAIYLVLVLFAYFVNANSILLSIIVIAVSTSTIDSAVASMEYIAGNENAKMFAITALGTWPFFMTNTAAEIWGWYASGRVFIVIPLIIMGVYYGQTQKRGI